MVHDRRIDEDEQLFSARRAAPLDHFEGLFGQPLGELARICDRRRRAKKYGMRPVMTADAPEAPKHVAQVAAEDAAVRVQLVDDHVAETFEQLRPSRMVRQDPRMHHVGITEDDVRA